MNKQRIAEAIASFRQTKKRGDSMTREVKGLISAFSTGGVIILLVERWTGWLAPVWLLGVAWILQAVAEYFIGLFDRYKLKFWQVEEGWGQKNVNQWEKKKMELLKEINDKIPRRN